jgi:hypothetical protein
MINPNRQVFKDTACVKKGIISGCPFCNAINSDLPKIGDRIRVLSDIFEGQIGEVVSSICPLGTGEILVHFIDFPIENSYVINTDSDLVELLPCRAIPQWAPPLSLKQMARLHWLVLSFCQEFSMLNKHRQHKPITIEFIHLVVYIWMKRLPLESSDLWAILEAHGISPILRNRLQESFNQFSEVLRIYHFIDTGRNYKKKKKVDPFSVEGIK